MFLFILRIQTLKLIKASSVVLTRDKASYCCVKHKTSKIN
jgi:hypothetical protein